MADYFSVDELEDRLGEGDFGTYTNPTDTMAGVMVTQICNMWDGFAHQAAGAETIDTETVKQACISAAVYQIGQMRAGETIDTEKQYAIFRAAVGPTGETSTLFYDQQYPSSGGKW